MNEQNLSPSFTLQNIVVILFLVASSVPVAWLAYINNYFTLVKHNRPKIPLRDFLIIFSIFVFASFFFPVLIYNFSLQFLNMEEQGAFTLPVVQFSLYIITILFLYLYSKFQNQTLLSQIWKDKTYPDTRSFFSDLKTSLVYLFVSIPLVLAVSEFTEILTNLLFGQVEIDQNAVLLLKKSLQSPWGLFLSLLSVIVLAPLLEEYLFRGVLQTTLRPYLGGVGAIVITSILFSLMHFSSQQSTTNIPLLSSLFIFSLFVSLLYERTRSLMTPIFLHVTFNSYSVIRIIFTEA